MMKDDDARAVTVIPACARPPLSALLITTISRNKSNRLVGKRDEWRELAVTECDEMR